MKPTKITDNGKKLYYLDINDKVIKIGDKLNIIANSGRNLGSPKRVIGILTEITQYGNFIINDDNFNIMAKCLYGRGGKDEIFFKCLNHETNGWTYSAEIL